jgi:hypothetical protein
MKASIFIIFLIPELVFAQEMRFLIEKSCLSTSQGIDFECRQDREEFTIIRNKNRYVGINSGTGVTHDLKLIESDKNITVLQSPVFFSGTSIIHITHSDNRFYWVEVAYSTVLRSREITVRSGKKLR